MKITRVTTAVVESNFDWTFIKIETDEGVTGYGEAYMGPGLAAVIREYARMLVGQDPTSIDKLVREMKGASVHVAPGLVCHAIAGIETALLDVTGKFHKLPVWQLLGGKYRDSVTIYADCHAGEQLECIDPLLAPRTPHWQEEKETVGGEIVAKHRWDSKGAGHLTPESYAQQARAMAEHGFRILKFDIDVPSPYDTDDWNRDLSGREIEYATSLVAAARDAVGPEVGLAIDCHWNYSVQAAIELARAVEPYNLLWFEDPVPPENVPALAEVQRATRLAVATGENHYQRVDFERLITEGGLRLLAPDVQKVGPWEGRKLADLCDMHYVNLTWHNISSPIGTMAGVQLSAAVPNFLALEWHAASVPFFDDLIKDAAGPLIQDGVVRVPDAPGLGIELDEDVAYRYRKPGEAFFD